MGNPASKAVPVPVAFFHDRRKARFLAVIPRLSVQARAILSPALRGSGKKTGVRPKTLMHPLTIRLLNGTPPAAPPPQGLAVCRGLFTIYSNERYR